MGRHSIIYKTLSDLVPVKQLLEEAGRAIDDASVTSSFKDIPRNLGAIGGAGIGAATGGVISATTGGVGSAGLTSAGLATGLAGGAAAVSIVTIAAPAVVLGITGYWFLSKRNRRKRDIAKEAYFQEAARKRDAILRELAETNKRNTERIEYLDRLVAALVETISNLEADLAIAGAG